MDNKHKLLLITLLSAFALSNFAGSTEIVQSKQEGIAADTKIFVGAEGGFLFNNKFLAPATVISATEFKNLHTKWGGSLAIGVIHPLTQDIDLFSAITGGYWGQYNDIYNSGASRFEDGIIAGFDLMLGARYNFNKVFFGLAGGLMLQEMDDFEEAPNPSRTMFHMLYLSPEVRAELGYKINVLEVYLSYTFAHNMHKSGRGDYFAAVVPTTQHLFAGFRWLFG